MTMRITPSILNADLGNLSGEIARIPSADGVHIDVMDNHFVPNLTIGLPVVETVAVRRRGLDAVREALEQAIGRPTEPVPAPSDLAREARRLAAAAIVSEAPVRRWTHRLDRVLLHPVGGVAILALVMFAIIFFWTPPHFWALAIFRLDDYVKANVPMFPVVYGVPATARWIVIYTLMMVPLTVLLVPLGAAGPIYLLAAVVLGLIFMALAGKVLATGSAAYIVS